MSVVSDPRVLRAIAHPTRNRILSELSASGSARAADLARELGIPANQASFHLRQLAKYGIVEEAPEEARDRRDRVWRVTADRGYQVNLNTLAESAGGDAAVAVYKDQLEARAASLARLALTDDGEEHSRRTVSDSAIRLSDDERDEFAEEIRDLFDRWRDRTRDRSVERRTYSLFMIFQPFPALQTDEAED